MATKALKVEPKLPVNTAARTEKNRARRIAGQAAFQARKAEDAIQRGAKRKAARESMRNDIAAIKAGVTLRA